MEKEIKITILYDDTQKLYDDTEKPTEDFDIKNLKNPKQYLLKKRLSTFGVKPFF